MDKKQKTLIGILIITLITLTFLFLKDYGYANEWASPIDSLVFSHWGSCISGLMATGAFIYAFSTFMSQKRWEEQKEIQNEVKYKKQTFENRFFKLVENLQFIVGQINLTTPVKAEIVDDKVARDTHDFNSLFITENDNKVKYRIYDNRPVKLTGREAIHILLLNLLKALPITTIDDLWEEDQTDQERETLRYDEFYERYFYLLGHYFRFFYRILVYIDESTVIDNIEKQSYIDFLQGQISTDEMGLIFYNAILNYKAKKKTTGEKKFFNLLEKYKVLENMDNNSVASQEHLKKYYPITFGA